MREAERPLLIFKKNDEGEGAGTSVAADAHSVLQREQRSNDVPSFLLKKKFYLVFLFQLLPFRRREMRDRVVENGSTTPQ